MARTISRREFARRAAGAVATASLATLAPGQEKTDTQELHPALPLLSKRLPKPIPEELSEAVSSALKTFDSLAEARLKHRLNEGSEPSTRFAASRAPRRRT